MCVDVGHLLIVFFPVCRPGNRVPEPQARWLFQQLAIALEFCHNRGIANRDVKLENILVDDKNSPMPLIKICDFGYSKVMIFVPLSSGLLYK